MLRQSFRPELLNRIEEIIVFRSLDRDQLAQITRLLLARVARRMHAQSVELGLGRGVRYLANAGLDPQYGFGEPSSGYWRTDSRNGCSRARSLPVSEYGSTCGTAGSTRRRCPRRW
jgi:hypothetical protein